jgi:glycosidase
MPMVWQELSYDPQQADPLGRPRPANPVAFDGGLFKFYQAAIKFRRDNSSLRRGDLEFIATDDQAEFLAFRRSDATGTLLVGLNRGGKQYTWNVPLAKGENASQVFTASGEVNQFTTEQKDGATIVTVPAVDGIVLRVSPKK